MPEVTTLEDIRKRDADSVATWFKEPALGACGRAFIDRRWLLARIDLLRTAIGRCEHWAACPTPDICKPLTNGPCGLRKALPSNTQTAEARRSEIDAAALADAHRMYEKQHGEPFKE